MNIKELEDAVHEIFGVDTIVRFHPENKWCLSVRLNHTFLFSEQIDKLSGFSKKYGLDVHTSLRGIVFKRLYLFITEKESEVVDSFVEKNFDK